MTDQFGALLRQLRLRMGLTQEGLAERAGLGVRSIRGIETGQRTSSRTATVRLLADALELGPEERRELMSASGLDDDPSAVASWGSGRRVRDIGGERLLGYGSISVPYLPRDVDDELDRALASPGAVLLVHDSSSGARRTGYEALRRMLPDAVLVVDPKLSAPWDDHPSADIVVWLDKVLTPDSMDRADIGDLEVWLRSTARHWVLAIVSDELMDSTQARALEMLNSRVIRISGSLSKREQQAVSERFPDVENVHTLQDFVDIAERREADSRPFDSQHAADYQADTPEGVDRMSITTDVRMLADLVASRLIEPPLSIGLFGPWGSGKSFFMRLMSQRVQDLADAAGKAELAAGTRGRSVSSLLLVDPTGHLQCLALHGVQSVGEPGLAHL